MTIYPVYLTNVFACVHVVIYLATPYKFIIIYWLAWNYKISFQINILLWHRYYLDHVVCIHVGIFYLLYLVVFLNRNH